MYPQIVCSQSLLEIKTRQKGVGKRHTLMIYIVLHHCCRPRVPRVISSNEQYSNSDSNGSKTLTIRWSSSLVVFSSGDPWISGIFPVSLVVNTSRFVFISLYMDVVSLFIRLVFSHHQRMIPVHHRCIKGHQHPLQNSHRQGDIVSSFPYASHYVHMHGDKI